MLVVVPAARGPPIFSTTGALLFTRIEIVPRRASRSARASSPSARSESGTSAFGSISCSLRIVRAAETTALKMSMSRSAPASSMPSVLCGYGPNATELLRDAGRGVRCQSSSVMYGMIG